MLSTRCTCIRDLNTLALFGRTSLDQHLRDRLERLQRKAAKIILRRKLYRTCDHDKVLCSAGLESLAARRKLKLAILGHALATRSAPPHLLEQSFPVRHPPYNTRRTQYFDTPIANTQLYQTSPLFHAAATYNQLSRHLQEMKGMKNFKAQAHLGVVLSSDLR